MKERIIVALDTDSPDSALAVVEALAGEVGMFKVGMELFPRGGPELVRKVRETGADVFLDLKFHDIPNTVAGAVRSAAALGVKFATVHASGGREMLARAAEAARGTGTTVLAVTVLTSIDESDLSEIGFSSPPADLVVRLARMAVREGIGGIVCSAREVAAVRELAGRSAVLVTPGVRLPEDAVGDQKRVVTPFDAMRNGADYLVVGRPITKAADPVAAARRFAAEMRSGREAGPRGS
ncbi:MAG: orotidine 5'-phosphate decarboxylase, orotidine-5'-phosphate decarboxylase [Deltaproteobacteria bacterium CSP1-8]|nr:MAG: orotidine 5'-phosphate decarboxylase, orotidine-5'-phosphate decarboxylase [Deltaproteobacteria bacterium CSP1-8]